MRGEGSATGHKNDGLVGYPFSQAATLPVQVLRPGQLGGQRKSPRGVGKHQPNDAAVLQLILNGIGHIGMRRGATSGAGRSVQIRAQAQERSVRRRVDLDTFGHVFQVAPSENAGAIIPQ